MSKQNMAMVLSYGTTDIFNRTTTTDYRGSSSEGGSKKRTVASYCE